MPEEGWLGAFDYYECLNNVHTLSLLTFRGGLASDAVYYAMVLSCISDDINSLMLNRFWGNEEEKKMTYYIYPETRFNLPLYLMLYFSLSHKHMLEPLQMMVSCWAELSSMLSIFILIRGTSKLFVTFVKGFLEDKKPSCNRITSLEPCWIFKALALNKMCCNKAIVSDGAMSTTKEQGSNSKS